MAITISGQNNNDKILASDGVLDQISGFNVVGVLTASTFETTGEITANHIDVGSTIQLGNAGIITATTLIGNVTGNVNSTSNLLLQISGSEKFRVGNGGQLGIGGANYGTSGQVLTSGGSGSAPTWSTIASDKITEGDTEAEVYDVGSNTARFTVKTEGSERLRITSDGKMGVGTASPNRTLTVQSNGGQMSINDTDNTNGGIFCNAGNFALYARGNSQLGDGSVGGIFSVQTHTAGGSTAERFRITSDGDVAIGRDSAQANYAAGTATTRLAVVKQSAGSGYHEIAHFTAGTDSNDTGAIVRITQFNNDRGLYIKAGRGTSDQAKAIFGLRNSGAVDQDVMTLLQGGYVGIGTDNTDRQLAVFDSSQGTIEIKSSDTGQSSLWFSDISDGNVGGVYYTHSNNAMVLRTNDVDRLRILADGKIIMGSSTTSTTQLDIRFTDTTTYSATSNHVNGLKIFNDSNTDNGFAGIELGATDGDDYYGSTLLKSIADGTNYSNDFVIQTRHSGNYAERLRINSDGVIQTGSKTITGGNNLVIQNFAVKGVWSGASAIGKSIELISGYDSAVKMAAIGYNLTDVNLGSTYGGDLTFHTQPLYSSPTTPLPERMRISSAGYVTKPDTPAFIVRHSAAEVYAAGSYIDGPWTVTLNRGNHFNTSNGIFTAPVAGLYQFNCMQNNDYSSGSNPSNFRCMVNNSLYAGMNFDQLDSHTGWFTHTLVGTLNLAKNDTVRLYTSSQARVDNYNWNHWSMYLIG